MGEEKRAYLAGPMRGHELFNFPAFDEAKRRIEVMGWTVSSPAQMDRDAGFDPAVHTDEDWARFFPGGAAEVMGRDLDAIRKADAIILLPEWESSKGVAVELAYAQFLDKRVLYYEATPHSLCILRRDTITARIAEKIDTEIERKCGNCKFREQNGKVAPCGTPDDPGKCVRDTSYPGWQLSGATQTVVGLRDNKGKPHVELCPGIVNELIGTVLWESAVPRGKYPMNNWRKGLKWNTEVLGSLGRHYYALCEGKDIDSESGLSHIAHLLTNAMFYAYYQKHGLGEDDRPKGETGGKVKKMKGVDWANGDNIVREAENRDRDCRTCIEKHTPGSTLPCLGCWCRPERPHWRPKPEARGGR